MRTIIFGCKGQLGRDLMGVFGAEGAAIGLDLPELDIANRYAVLSAMRQGAPDLVINAAAYTDVEAAESHPEAAFRANDTGARIVAEAAAMQGVPVVYISTDYVFDGGKKTPYVPGDSPRPLNVYGKSKEAGERATRAATSKHFIVRTAWMYGPGGNHFVEKIRRAAAEKPQLRVVEDEIGSPTSTHDLALALLALCRTQAYGVYHAVNAGACSRCEMAREIVRLAKLKTKIIPCSSAEYPTVAQRPRYSVLDSSALERQIGRKMRPWQVALKDYLAKVD